MQPMLSFISGHIKYILWISNYNNHLDVQKNLCDKISFPRETYIYIHTDIYIYRHICIYLV